MYSDADRPPCSRRHDQPFGPRDRRVEQVALERQVVLRQQRDDDGGAFRTLALVHRRDEGVHQFATRVG